MNARLFFLPLMVLVLSACSGMPSTTELTPSQELVITSGLRLSTLTYITRGKTQAEQAQRAQQVMSLTATVRTFVADNNNMVLSLDAAAAVANVRIMESNLSPGDKQLAQGIVTEAMLLAGDQAVMPHPDIGEANAQRLLAYLTQIERVAKIYAPGTA